MLVRTLGAAIGFWAIAASVSAQTFTLPSRTVGLTPIQGQMTNIQTVRLPRGAAVTGSETRVTLKFELLGCLDKLMPLLSHADVQGDRATIYVTALNVHTADSMTARCRALPQTTAQVKIPGIFQRNQVRVVFLNSPQ